MLLMTQIIARSQGNSSLPPPAHDVRPPPQHILKHFHVSSATLANINTCELKSGVLLDSGSTVHIFSSTKMFSTLEPVSPGDVRVVLANGTVSNDIQGRGTVLVNTIDSRGRPFSLTLNNALYMPNLNYIGIVSVKLLLDQGMQVLFKNPHPYIRYNNTKVPMQIRNNLYHLNAVKNVTKLRKTAMQWHQIMGHMSFEAILKLPGVTRGMEISHRDVRDCLECIRGKTKISHNRTPDQRATIPFSFVHSDIHGPKNVPETLNGYNYLVNFVDDATNFIAVYAIERKSDLPGAFEQFLADHAPYGTVTRLRSDCGAEYTSAAFKSIIRKNKIRHELSSPYSPWQNGGAERAWGTLGSNVRCMMQDTAVPTRLWWLAYKHAAFIYNRSYVSRIHCTPYELAMGYKPDLSNMHKFGASVEAYNHRQEGKLAPRTKPGIYVGHKNNTTGYLIYFEDEDSIRTVLEVRFPFEWKDAPPLTPTLTCTTMKKVSQCRWCHPHSSTCSRSNLGLPLRNHYALG